MNKLYIFILTIIIFTFNSCDILRFSPFEVSSWTPGKGYHDEPEEIIVSLNFSGDPDTASVEKNFSLTGDGNRVKGAFSWNGKKIIFMPLTPLEKNTDYIINVAADAHDKRGLSMDEAFSASFTTRIDNTRPFLLSCYPELFAEIDDQKTEVRLCFSIPVPLNALYDNVSFSPSIPGTWLLEDDGKTAVFTPAEPWSMNTKYEIRVSTSLTDNNGMNIGKEFISIFTIGTDREAPSLLSAHRITKDNERIELLADKGFASATEPLVENSGWEKEDKLFLVFSKPVDGLTLKNYLSADDAPNLVMETSLEQSSNGYNSEYYFYFNSIPLYESRFTIRLKPGVKDSSGNESKDEYIYRIFANGEFSKPPSLMGLRMPMAPENTDDMELFSVSIEEIFKTAAITVGHYPSGGSISTWIELYFDTAQGAAIDLFSVMELFRIETSNNVITFSPRQVKITDFSVTEPQEGWENYQRIEITGNLINSTYFGIIYFLISSGLRDSLGNKNENPQRIAVMK